MGIDAFMADRDVSLRMKYAHVQLGFISPVLSIIYVNSSNMIHVDMFLWNIWNFDQLLYWLIVSDAKDSTNKIQRLEFLENLYSKYIGLTVSILPKEEMLDVSDLGQNFNDMVILFQTVFKVQS